MAKKRKVDEEFNSPDPDSAAANGHDSDSDSDPEEDIAKTLEPFNKEQLIDILRTAVSNDPNLITEINRVADVDPAHRKIFVHGLSWETTSDKLRSFFSQFGEIEDCNVVADKATGKSKGYGFLLFKHRRSAQKSLKDPQKKIDNRMTACQLASAGPVLPTSHNSQQGQYPVQNHDTLARKIYVGNVHSEISAVKLLSFFSKYGEIEEGPLGFDKQTGKSKGFALFIYKTVEGVRKALEEPYKNFEGNQLYCQKATDSNKKRAIAATSTAMNNPHTGSVSAAPPGFSTGGDNAGFAAGSGVGFVTQDMAASATSAALLGQGLLSGALPFGQGVQPNQAALAVLAAAAGQNPAAFGVSPAVLASLTPALAAALNAATPQQVAQPAVPPGFGIGNTGYHNMQSHQGANPYQNAPMGHGPVPRPHSAPGPIGGYGPR